MGLARFGVAAKPFPLTTRLNSLFSQEFPSFSIRQVKGTAVANSIATRTVAYAESPGRCKQSGKLARTEIVRRKKMTNRHTLKFSIFAAAALALCLPVVAAAQWGGYPDNRNGSYGRYDDRYLRDSVKRLDSLAKKFESDMDRALDRSRVDGTRREDQINSMVHDFRRAVGNLKSRVGNGRDLNRSENEAAQVLQLADQIDRIGVRRLDSRTSSEWSQIQSELRNISDIYRLNYRGSYGDDRGRNGNNRNNRNDDWWRRIPFPR